MKASTTRWVKRCTCSNRANTEKHMETSTDVQLAKELSKNAAGQKAKSGQMDTLKSVTGVTKLVGLCEHPPGTFGILHGSPRES